MTARRRNQFVALLAALVAGAGLTIGISLSEDGTPSLEVTVGKRVSPQAQTITVDADTEREPAEQVEAADETPADEGPGVHEDLVDETPAGAPPDAPEEVLEAKVPGIGKPLPLAGAQNYSCTWRPVRNHSSRSSRVEMVVLHVAVVRPRSGALPAIRRLFDTSSFGASSHIGMDLDGSCEQWVAYNRKAWTQGAFNSVSESVELMAMSTEPRSYWLAQPIFRRGILAAWVADRLRANGLPPVFVDPEGCTPKAGFTDHDRLECGNSHVDVGSGFPFDVFERQVKRAYHGGNAVPLRCTRRNIEKLLHRRYPEMGIRVDGTIGNRARAAIRRFQRGNYLRVNGVVGPLTGRKLGLEGCGA